MLKEKKTYKNMLLNNCLPKNITFCLDYLMHSYNRFDNDQARFNLIQFI